MSDKIQSASDYPGVMISSSFNDLIEHRKAMMHALNECELHANVMEDKKYPQPFDLLQASLNLVIKSKAYICIIGARYGTIHKDEKNNPNNYSLTELEFDEAIKLKLPALLFIMGDDHDGPPLRERITDAEDEKRKAFKEKAKRKCSNSGFPYTAPEFNSLDDFIKMLHPAINALKEKMKSITSEKINTKKSSKRTDENIMPPLPDFYAKPDYISSFVFTGRRAELETLDDWAKPADTHSVLLFDAIGGSGKSMLTWHWVKNNAKQSNEWAGIFWYSFYEKGAVMDDFCQHALAYIKQEPLENFEGKKTGELTKELLAFLKQKPYLFILDGLERVLVAYNRIDAPEVRDEDLDTPKDIIINRNPTACLHKEDDNLLLNLASANPSKILISSRLFPSNLFNHANQPIPGVKRAVLTGLRPNDAEAMIRTCGVTGNSQELQNYITTNCDCHPLTIGVLAGLINVYPPDRGNFDAWVKDADYGAQLNLSELDLKQRRNHILDAAMNALPEKSKALLSTIALFYDAINYDTLKLFNPFSPPEPDEIDKPDNLEDEWDWKYGSEEEKKSLQKKYEEELVLYKNYQQELAAYKKECNASMYRKPFDETLMDLENRGLLQYDRNMKKYDLHPVVRGVASGRLKKDEALTLSGKLIDYFSSQPHNPYKEVKSLDEVRNVIHHIRLLLKLEKYEEAYEIYNGDFYRCLIYNLNEYHENLYLLKPFFPNGFHKEPISLELKAQSNLSNIVGLFLSSIGDHSVALKAYGISIKFDILNDKANDMAIMLINISSSTTIINRQRLLNKTIVVSEVTNTSSTTIFVIKLDLFSSQSIIGNYTEADTIWMELAEMSRDLRWNQYRLGDAEYYYAYHLFRQGKLKLEDIENAKSFAIQGNNRSVIQYLYELEGLWYKSQCKWKEALASFNEAVSMARAVKLVNASSEANVILCSLMLGAAIEVINAELENILQLNSINYLTVAETYAELGNRKKAIEYALKAYTIYWDDGEPYVNRYWLDKTIELLHKLGEPIPQLPPFDESKIEKFDWEDELDAYIEKKRKEKEEKDKEEEE